MIKKILIAIVILAALGAALYFAQKQKETATLLPMPLPDHLSTFTDPLYGVSFTYPKAWGRLKIESENKLCPEEDTYRTPDTLTIFDSEYRFPDKNLPGSQSFMHSGLRVYRIDPLVSNGCNDELLRKLALREIQGEEISSFRLRKAGVSGFYGVFNEEASRLDTEGRLQYTLFTKAKDSPYVLILQPYMSFVPYGGSPERAEIEASYSNDMGGYLASGETAEPIRDFIAEFKAFAESVTFGN